ncbi:MAG: hypothetical protein K0U20_09285 [Proteobacteria bacterium]|nr:hypothetical protein [Pseudomonadota bacterium]MCH9735773.1 hypothetical protein [Actinomycetes bacterium]
MIYELEFDEELTDYVDIYRNGTRISWIRKDGTHSRYSTVPKESMVRLKRMAMKLFKEYEIE